MKQKRRNGREDGRSREARAARKARLKTKSWRRVPKTRVRGGEIE